MTHFHVDFVALLKRQRSQTELILKMAYAVSLGIALLVDKATDQGVDTQHLPCLAILFDNQVQTSKRIFATDAQSDFLHIGS